MNISGFTDKATAEQWQIDLLQLSREPRTPEEITWFEKNGSNILFDSRVQLRSGREKEVFVPPTYIAMSAPKD